MWIRKFHSSCQYHNAIRILEWWGRHTHLKPAYTRISKPEDKGVALVAFVFLFCCFKLIVSLMHPNKNSANQSTVSAYDSMNSSILLSRWEYHLSLNSCCQLSNSGSLARSSISKLRNQRSFGSYPSILYQLSPTPATQPIRQRGDVHWLDGLEFWWMWMQKFQPSCQ